MEYLIESNKAVAGDGGDAIESARALRAALDTVLKQLSTRAFRGEDLRAMFAGLVADGISGQYRDYAGAEQATMAMASLASFLVRRGELGDARAVNAALDKVYETVKDDERYKPERFRTALEDLSRTVTR